MIYLRLVARQVNCQKEKCLVGKGKRNPCASLIDKIVVMLGCFLIFWKIRKKKNEENCFVILILVSKCINFEKGKKKFLDED